MQYSNISTFCDLENISHVIYPFCSIRIKLLCVTLKTVTLVVYTLFCGILKLKKNRLTVCVLYSKEKHTMVERETKAIAWLKVSDMTTGGERAERERERWREGNYKIVYTRS